MSNLSKCRNFRKQRSKNLFTKPETGRPRICRKNLEWTLRWSLQRLLYLLMNVTTKHLRPDWVEAGSGGKVWNYGHCYILVLTLLVGEPCIVLFMTLRLPWKWCSTWTLREEQENNDSESSLGMTLMSLYNSSNVCLTRILYNQFKFCRDSWLAGWSYAYRSLRSYVKKIWYVILAQASISRMQVHHQ